MYVNVCNNPITVIKGFIVKVPSEAQNVTSFEKFPGTRKSRISFHLLDHFIKLSGLRNDTKGKSIKNCKNL